MGTKSHIAIERKNGAVESIRCQYDGYPAYNGALLLQHYNTPDRVNALIGLGNITYLAEELEPSFEEPQEGVTLAYGRERQEACKTWEGLLYLLRRTGKNPQLQQQLEHRLAQATDTKLISMFRVLSPVPGHSLKVHAFRLQCFKGLAQQPAT